MYRRFHRFLVLAVLSFAAAACVSVPEKPDAGDLAVAKRFLHNIDAGEWALLSIRLKIDEESKDQPGMAELTRRAFADLTPGDIEDMISEIYARHVTREHLAELVQFTETKTGKRFFRIGFISVINNTHQNMDEVMRQFNADELGEILKFSQSEAAAELTRELPAINEEVSNAARKMGEDRMREYIKKL